MTGKKDDGNSYEKVDYSLVPKEVIQMFLTGETHAGTNIVNNHYKLFSAIHQVLNGKISIDIVPLLFRGAVKDYGVKYLAVSLGLGLSKYKERDNWKKFDNNPERFLKAVLRHLMALMMGEHYDGEHYDGYSKGNDHRGAVCFNLMIVCNILKKRNVKNGN